MGIIINDYSYDSVGIHLSNVYASTFGTEIRFRNDKTQGMMLTFTYFIWVSLDARRSNKSCIGSVSKHVMYDETLPVMTQVYNDIKSDYPGAIDIITDPLSAQETVI
jgi:hypothetical protein